MSINTFPGIFDSFWAWYNLRIRISIPTYIVLFSWWEHWSTFCVISGEERVAMGLEGVGGFTCQPEKQRLRTLRGYCLVRGKGHKSFQVWNEMIREGTGGFKCQLEGITAADASFLPHSIQHTLGCFLFSPCWKMEWKKKSTPFKLTIVLAMLYLVKLQWQWVSLILYQ